MEQLITQDQFIEWVGNESYIKFSQDIYELIKKSEAYKSKDEAIFYIGATPLNDEIWFHYEATLKKLPIGDDFGFTKMLITDNLDVTLDKINDAKRIINGEFATIKQK